MASKGNTEKVHEHEGCSIAAHLQLLLEAISGLQSSVPPPAERSVQYPALDLLLQGQNATPLSPQPDSELETDGADMGANDKALSLHDDQAELEVGQQLHALQQRLQIMENIISALNREVEKTQLTVVALERDNHNSMQVVQHLETVVGSISAHISYCRTWLELELKDVWFTFSIHFINLTFYGTRKSRFFTFFFNLSLCLTIKCRFLFKGQSCIIFIVVLE